MRTCKICGAPITRNAKRELCLNCGVRDSWIGRRQRGADNNAAEIRRALASRIQQCGILPLCRQCIEDCKQPDVRMTWLVCKKSPEYGQIARRMEFVENVVKPGIERMISGLA